MQRLHIFRAGRHRPMSGPTLDFAAADLVATARAYDPARHEAPIVVGHPILNAPAYGWVESLAAEGDGLHAAPRQVDPAFAAMVEAGRFKKISASFWHPDAADNPTPGVWALRHVGFLGAAPPAVTGLKPVAFAGEAAGVTTIEFSAAGVSSLAWLFSDVVGLFGRLRDRIIAKDGLDAADEALPAHTLQSLMQGVAHVQQMDTPAPAFAAPSTPETQDDPSMSQDNAAREAAITQREAALAERETAIQNAELLRRRQDAADFAARLVREARLPQGLAPCASALLASLPDTGVVSFAAADGKTTAETPAAALRGLLAALPAGVSFGKLGDRAPGEAPEGVAEFAGHRVDSDRMDLHRRVLAWQAQHPDTDYEAALRAVAPSA